MCGDLQLQIDNIRDFFTSRWFHKYRWYFICVKILKNHLNYLLSNISCSALPTWILCCHSKVKSPASAPLQPSILAKITSYCFLPGGQECTWTQHTTPLTNLSVSVTESDHVPEHNSSLYFRIQRISTWLDDISLLDIWILIWYIRISVFLFCFHLVRTYHH